MTGDRIRCRVRVHGRVQGVFFRDSVRGRADAHDVAGWVRNCADGTVEAVFEGEAERVGRLVRFCKTGPPRADVERCEVSQEEPSGLDGFSVR
jgi:acylphosphatase